MNVYVGQSLDLSLRNKARFTTRSRLPDAVDAPRRELQIPGVGRISYYDTGPSTGRPLVLVHSINAAPSVFEMRPLFEHYRSTRRVVAPDLPGFGFSERADRRYSPELYVSALTALLREVVGEPADVVAFSLSAEFAAAAAREAPELVRSLVLLSPTGFSSRTMPGGKTGERIHGVLSLPGLSHALYAGLTTRPSIRYFLRKAFVGPVPPEMVDYAYATTHQPGARHAPLYFLSGQLFTSDATGKLYDKVSQPALVLYDRDANINFELLPEFLQGHANWRAERIAPTLGLPHWEKPAETTATMERFWQANV